jgi:hypothetical protein
LSVFRFSFLSCVFNIFKASPSANISRVEAKNYLSWPARFLS